MVVVTASLCSGAFAITPSALRCERRVEPLGIDVARPRLSWVLDAGRQTAYQVVVEGAWDSGKVASDQSVAVEYAGPALKSQTSYGWRVRAWDKDGVPGEWSPQATFVTGVLGEPWQGKWIADGEAAIPPKRIGYHAGETTTDETKWVQVSTR
jgi:alpha-L-rhamnosidase